MIEPIILFKVKTLPLPADIGFSPVYFPNSKGRDFILNQLYNKIQNKTWTVAGIKVNPRYSPRVGEEPPYLIFRQEDEGSSRYYPRELPCNLFLLVREGETPIWWPDICCDVVEVPKGKTEMEK